MLANRPGSELSDAAAALDWTQTISPEAKSCWIAGFSFGAWIGMQLLMRRPEIEGFISVAPPANLHDFTFLAPCPSSGLIIHGDADKVVPQKDVQTLVDKLKTQKGIKIDQYIVRGSNHFLIGVFKDRRPDSAIVVSVEDNLVKGASGQAVQNMNLVCGFPETTGLEQEPLFP